MNLYKLENNCGGIKMIPTLFVHYLKKNIQKCFHFFSCRHETVLTPSSLSISKQKKLNYTYFALSFDTPSCLHYSHSQIYSTKKKDRVHENNHKSAKNQNFFNNVTFFLYNDLLLFFMLFMIPGLVEQCFSTVGPRPTFRFGDSLWVVKTYWYFTIL